MDTFEEAAVSGDAALLRQLLDAILENAVKFTPAGGRVRVRVSSESGRPTVAVEDTGVGIPADQLPQVFDRFYRGDAARGRSDGAGLGLAIARWIADAHGADIAIGSEAGRGTRVTIRFPPVLSSS
jgi:signal transduction histidine kinase